MFSGTPENALGAPVFDRPIIVGVDEAGRGPLAGPVVAGAVLLCKGSPDGLADSKQLSAKRRAILDEQLRQSCYWAVGIVEPEEIDQLNILVATMRAMTLAVSGLAQCAGTDPDEVLIDGNMTPAGRAPDWRWNGRTIVGGDATEPAISAASIIAKEWRDRLMVEAAIAHPHYGWERNKGYGTREHMQALREHGSTPLHRQSFAPVAQLALL
ncbi:MAG: ribonuclease HII [Erythrobacter sp.]